MIQFDKLQMLEDHAVYDDDGNENVWNLQKKYYVLPNGPRFRRNEKNQPIFKFIKYRFPVDRADGKKGGGVLIFDVEFVVPEEKKRAIGAKLQEDLNKTYKDANPKPTLVISQLQPISDSPLGRPACTVQTLSADGVLVDKVQNFGRPSLYGNFVTSVMVELTPEGAILAEQALQGKGASIVQVVYNLPLIVRTPPIKAEVHFSASKFMSYVQSVSAGGGGMYGGPKYRHEFTKEKFISSETAWVKVDPGMVTDQKVVGPVTDWAWSSLEKAVTTMLVEKIDPVKDDQRKVDESLNRLTRVQIAERVADYHRYYEGKQVIAWDPTPQGTLEVITTIPGVEWSDYATEIDLNDEFFKQLNLSIQANADFEALPLHSIDVHIEYPLKAGKKAVKDFNIKSPNDIVRFNSSLENNNWKYKYSYKVHYDNMSEVLQVPLKESEETFLTIDVGGTGILTVELEAGDLDFETLKMAQVTLRYEPTNKPPVEQTFTMNEKATRHRFQKVIRQTIDKPYKYKIKYIMKDGTEFSTDWRPSDSTNLMVNDVWSATRTFGIRARGDLEEKVDAILVDLVYSDAVNKYSQTKSIALTKDNKFFDWVFPVINETGGKIAYSGTIKYTDNSEEAIPKTETTANTILVGPKVMGFLRIEVLPDLLDWSLAKLVKVTISYVDAANNINARKDFIFKDGVTDAGVFNVEQKDITKTSYTWQATYFMQDGAVQKGVAETSEELTLVLQVPV